MIGAAFGESFAPVFGLMAPLLGLAFLLALVFSARPFRTTAHVTAAT